MRSLEGGDTASSSLKDPPRWCPERIIVEKAKVMQSSFEEKSNHITCVDKTTEHSMGDNGLATFGQRSSVVPLVRPAGCRIGLLTLNGSIFSNRSVQYLSFQFGPYSSFIFVHFVAMFCTCTKDPQGDELERAKRDQLCEC